MIDIKSVWGVDGIVRSIHPSVWEVGDYVLKKGGRDALERNVKILQRLRYEGIRVAEPVPSLSHIFVVGHGNGHYMMTKRLQGENIGDIYQLGYSKYAFETGRVAARLHKAFRAIERDTPISGALFSEELQGWIPSELERSQWRLITYQDFCTSTAPVLLRYENLPKQLIHRDFHFGNILFCNGVFSGYIDFDLSKWDIRLFDLAYFLTGLLPGCEKDACKAAAWFDICTAFLEGYEQTEPLSEAEKEAMPFLMQCIECLFVAYFTKINQPDAAADSFELYRYIKENGKKLSHCINGGGHDTF